MSRLLIKGGRIVTAVDDYPGDVLVEGEKVSAIFAHGQTPAIDAPVLDATGKLVIPGGIDVHTHLDMPFGGTTSADDFESGTIAAAHGGTTSIVDFAIQYKGQALREALGAWMQKAEGKAAIDYGFHMIVTDLPDAVEKEMDVMVAEGVTSFKLFMAYRGVLMLDDGSIFRAFLKTGRERRDDLHARRERRRDRRPREARARRGPHRPEVARADAPAARRGRGDVPRDLPRRDGGRPALRRPPLGRRGAREDRRGARPRAPDARGDLPAVPLPLAGQLRRGRTSRAPSTSCRPRCARRATRRRSGAA